MNLPNFWYGSCSYGPLWENNTLYAGKILIWQNFGHLRPKFDHFLPKLTEFLVPCIAVGTYGLAFVRSSVRSSVRQRSQNLFIWIYWFLAQSWGFLIQRKWRFRILPEKSCLAVIGLFLSKNGHFWPKINVSAYFSKSPHRVFLVLHI